ncbi:MAG: addiction module protein [Verrucomicrobiota bacterium]
MKAIAEITKEAMKLPPGQRLTLARILLDASENQPDYSPAIEAAWEKLIFQRIDDVKSGQVKSSNCNDVFTRLDKLFPG